MIEKLNLDTTFWSQSIHQLILYLFMLKPVQLTQSASEAVNRISTAKKIGPEYHLRIGTTKLSGCGAADFILGFDKKKESDLIYNTSNISVIIKKADVLYLQGITLDYVTRNGESGFVFDQSLKNRAS